MFKTAVNICVAAALAGSSFLALGTTSAAAAAAVPAGSVFAQDHFARTVAGSLGTADQGGRWAIAPGGNALSSFSVDSFGAVARNLRPGSTVESQLIGGQSLDTVVSGSFTPVSPAATAALAHSYEARRQADGSAYLGRVAWTAPGALHLSIARRNGTTETVLGGQDIPVAAGDGVAVHLDVAVTGTTPVTIAVRAYRQGTVAPAWQYTVTDTSPTRITTAGAVGIVENIPTTSPAVTTVQKTFLATTTDAQPVTAPAAGAPVTTPPATTPPVTTPPVTTPVTTPVTPPVTPPAGAPTQTAVGSLPVGQAAYPVPAGSVYVDPAAGSDTAAGTIAAPVKTITKALTIAGTGGTVVLRAGTYHEKVTSAAAAVTIENYPGEAAWLDGSVPVTGLTPSGTAWTAPWTATFDHSSSFTKGDTTGTGNDGWHFVNPTAPLAAWPDEAFLDGAQLAQVSGTPGHGQFSVNYTTHTISFGDNPAGHQIRATDLDQAMLLSGSNVTVRGIGVRRYATPLPEMGTVYLAGTGDTLQNLTIADTATEAISDGAANQTLDHLTITDAGMTGIHANHADSLTINHTLITGSNHENFNAAPSAGGIKIGFSNHFRVLNSHITDNNATGIWTDENVDDITVANSQITGNTNQQVMLELSADAIVANNTITGGQRGLFISDTARVQVYNNLFGDNNTGSVFMAQDSRSVAGMPQTNAHTTTLCQWITRDVTIANNIFAANPSPYGFQIYALDHATNTPANKMNITITGNLLHQKGTTTNTMTALGGNDNTTLTRYETPTALTAAYPADTNNTQTPGQPTIAAAAAQAGNTTQATPLPAAIAAATGQTTGTQHLGQF